MFSDLGVEYGWPEGRSSLRGGRREHGYSDRAVSRPEPTPEQRAFTRAALIGSLASLPVFLYVLAIGRRSLLRRDALGGFYDAQAHALLAGHWDIPLNKLGFEAFLINGKAYTYLGPWSSILRMPIALFTHRFDGRLTQLSILAAFVVFMIATARLLGRIRELARDNNPVTRAEQITVAAFMFLLGAGSIVVFLASRPVVYHEAELWGAAWSVAAFGSILRYTREPSTRALVWSGVFTTLAMSSRGSVGLAPLVALGIIFLGRALQAIRAPAPARWIGLAQTRTTLGDMAVLFTTLVIPVALYAYVNVARFGTPFKLPIDKQVATTIDPIRPKIFATTHGSLFASKFVPTDLLALTRLDALHFTRVFPYVTFGSRAGVVGNITFASIVPSASLTTLMPVFVLLAVAGLVFFFRRPLAALRPLVAGGIVGTLGVVTIPFVDQRYLSDFLPLVIVLAGAGLFCGLTYVERWSHPARVVVAVVAVALALVSVWVNLGITLVYQREYSPFTTDPERAAFVRFQQAAPGGSHLTVRQGAQLPKPLAGGTLFVVGDCAGVYWTDGASWFPIERTNATGHFDVDLTLPSKPPGTTETIAVAGPPQQPMRFAIEYTGPDTYRFVVSAPNLTTPVTSPDQHVGGNRTVRAEILYDPNVSQSGVFLAGQPVAGSAFPIPAGPVAIAGRDNDPALSFSGTAQLLSSPANFCHQLRNA
jgi:hypothetical protein